MLHFIKKSLLQVFILTCTWANAQVSQLEKLCAGTFYSASPVKDDGNNIKGYFLLYKNDEVAKNVFKLEFVLLDENLNRVTGGSFTEAKDPGAERVAADVTLCNNKVLVALTDAFEGGHKGYLRYRMLDLGTNKLSDSFINRDGKPVFKEYFDLQWRKNYENEGTHRLEMYNGVGLVLYSPELDKKNTDRQKFIAHYDDSFNLAWKYVYDEMPEKKGDQKWAEYLQSDKDLIVLMVCGTRQGKKYEWQPTLHFIDAKTGSLFKETLFPDNSKMAYGVKNCVISKDGVVLLGEYMPLYNGQYNNAVGEMFAQGFFKLTYGKDFVLKDKKLLEWKDMAALGIDKKGEIPGEGFLYVHNMLPQQNGSVLVLGEAFKLLPVTANNIYFIELTADFKLNQVLVSEKFRNKFPGTVAVSSDIKKYGGFDLLDYQNLGNGEYLFFFNDNEKDTKNRKKTTLYGIVHYDGAKFERQTLNLKTDASRIYAESAKKGHILLFERFDAKGKSAELRLEKVNY